ncbi:hypothetical protein SAMN02799630_02523 [Paenibacillus sp. UNCCL117]|uniref:hypothetical protein n=1 Tax=unclassified Paenibacillus TaxID=185978 RepID=UPI000891B49A|nr:MULTISPECIES: hypothetical protein [unclassified Paenibacillus]SDC04529.1 hypothetical protein SAMN04488602_101192 [Paenibacillus sp. cl123]SFW37343.1 hypothetical protein SAMN02799630_02523 [Paenibacillus sp. UNCCL117]
MRKKGLISLVFIAVVLSGGGYMAYKYALNLAADKIAVELSSKLAKDSELSGELDKLIASNLDSTATPGKEPSKPTEGSNGAVTGKVSEGNTSAGSAGAAHSAGSEDGQTNSSPQPPTTSTDSSSNPKSDLQFSDRQAAVKFVMGRFTASEINNIRKMASGELTSEKKAELKKIAYSKFTQAEIDAVRVAVSK